MLVGMGLLRLGFLANFLSHPVISGFVTASGLIIAASQLEVSLGVTARGDNLLALLRSLAANLGQTNLPTLVLGGATLAFLFWVRRTLEAAAARAGSGGRAPPTIVTKAGPVAAVVATILAVWALGLDAPASRSSGDVPGGLPPFTVPAFDRRLWLRSPVPRAADQRDRLRRVDLGRPDAGGQAGASASTPTRSCSAWAPPISPRPCRAAIR